MTITIRISQKGSASSGNYGHEGRPGKEGGSLPQGKGHTALGGGAYRAEQGMGTSAAKPKPAAAAPGEAFNLPLPQLSIPTGPVPPHEEGDSDGKKDYQAWYESQKVKPGLADALAMRKYFADRARQAEGERNRIKTEQAQADYQKRQAEAAAKGPALTPAQKKKQEAAAKKAASQAASAAKKKASEEAKAKKKAESDAARKKKAEEAAAKKKAAGAKPASNAAAKRQQEAQRKLEEKLRGQDQVAESIGMSADAFHSFRDAFTTLKAGGDLDTKILGQLQGAGLVKVSGERIVVPPAARSLLSAILAGDALKAQDALEKLQAGGKEYIGQVQVRKITKVVIG